MNPPSLLYPMSLAPMLEGSMWILALGIGLSLAMLLWLGWRHTSQLFRPASMIAGLVLVFYSIPALLYAKHWYPIMPSGLFLTCCAAIPLFLSVYVWISRAWWAAKAPSTFVAPEMGAYARLGWPMLAWLATLAIYLLEMPLDCTALAALRTDPSSLLLARELSLKWLGSTPATYAYAMLVSCTAPVALWALLTVVLAPASSWRLRCLALIGSACVGASLLLTGAKGNLIPTAIFLMAAWISSAQRPWQAIRLGMGVGVMMVAGLYAMEATQGASTTQPYPFTHCVQRLHQCAQAHAVLQSMTRPEGALGLDQTRIRQLRQEISILCKNRSANTKTNAILKSDHFSGSSSHAVFSSIAIAIAYRAFVTPMQVASWYFLDRAEHGPRGWVAIPVIGRMLGTILNMPELLYQRYGTVYSAGDATKGSTAPTSYLMGYPAYLGMAGLGIALLLVIGLDIAACLARRYAPAELAPMIVGFSAVASVNSMSTDFFSLLLTHGALLAGILTACMLVTLSLMHKNASSG